jgi:SAM-dependent methyltransferase
VRDHLPSAPELERTRVSPAATAPASSTASVRTAAELLERNRRFYDALWAGARIVDPARFNTWPLVCSLIAPSRRRLEVAPGLRPRLPIEGTDFVDFSVPALSSLRESGARTVLGLVTSLPFPDRAFDLVCALDIIEHVDDDRTALSELARVAAPRATILVSVPLHPSHWTVFDEFVGHRRRYEPSTIRAQLAEQGLWVEQSAVFGMQPSSQRLLDFAMWSLEHRREKAMWWYNRIVMPVGLRLQKDLALAHGWIDTRNVDEILLLCRKR